MGIFGRLGTLLKANINDMISKAEDPEKILNQLILDMKDSLVTAKKQVAVAIADEKRLKKQLENELSMSSEWEKKAMMAVRAGKDDLAKEALMRKTEHDNLASEYQKQWELQKAATDSLRSSLRQLNTKIEEAKRKKNLLIARQKRARAQKQIQSTLAGMNQNSAFDAFDRMADKIEKEEAEAEAETELANEFSGDTLDAKFSALEENQGSDDALSALKAKMGLAQPAEASSFSVEEENVGASSSAGSSSRWDREDF
ncbi:MAG: hypothetical protein AUK47_11215 [Deltaproteobacteria bacterium CG2_30_63_29]|nr:MAG: hypothetical protein AUK47_11215 [Deltaproteobacteria bacterium CG2_30_63_29]PIW01482.1 MAG: hypothetical protein COW42_04730 [Deltaproteobacteria bacterium CG17_big_fil_post_rev_8_21_14_2_50_63_7]PJB36381.1 MAG: hypothetical protein CO108_23405 [Deltaproteobacteria bacterium CG_4_9_14_3_um_filter_63_12]